MDKPEEKLNALYTILDGYEAINPRHFSHDLLKLRHSILYFYSLIDNSLDWMIVFKIAPLRENPESIEEGEKVAMQHVDILRLLLDIPFSRKVSLAVEFEVISHELETLLKYLSKVRNHFAHPTKATVEPYENIHKQIEVVSKLKETYEQVHDLMKKYNFIYFPLEHVEL